ncbi:MAG: hypothetical protein KDD64_13600 [Bdellovibrionales bacterium]|nr:hypothetical protein [Bdellovibrionales bacterium]
MFRFVALLTLSLFCFCPFAWGEEICLLSFQIEGIPSSSTSVEDEPVVLEFAEVVSECSKDLSALLKEVLEELDIEGEPKNAVCTCSD